MLFIKSNLAILYMSNIGYVLAHVFALAASCCCAATGPNWPTPIKDRLRVAADRRVPVVLNAVFLVVGALAPKLNGYGTWTDFAIGVGILVGSLLLFVYRRVVEDKEGVHLREDVPQVPDAEEMRC